MFCFRKLLNKNIDSLNNTHFPIVNSLHGVNSQYYQKKSEIQHLPSKPESNRYEFGETE